MGVLPGLGPRLGGDRDADGILDGDEAIPGLAIASLPTAPRLSWPNASGDWFVEFSHQLESPWTPLSGRQVDEDGSASLPLSTDLAPARFFRLRRTW